MTLQEIQGFISFITGKYFMSRRNIEIKYFQIEEDELILCLREENKHRFTDYRIPMQHKLAMEISSVKTVLSIQNDHGNFQRQNFG